VLREVGHGLTLAVEDSEPEIVDLAGGEPRSPGTEHVTLAGDSQPTGPLAVIVVATDVVPAVLVRRGSGTTDDRFAEVDPDAEQRNHSCEQRQDWYRGSHLVSPELSGVKHV
jgi:hypothetical protein